MKKLIALILCLSLLFTPLCLETYALQGESRQSVKVSDMHPELVVPGVLMRLVLPRFTKGFFRFANFFLDNFGRGVNLATGVDYEQKFIKRDDGTRLRVCIYTPKVRKENVPGLLWIHGGGYGLGIPEQDFIFIRDFVEASGCVVVAPDYTNSMTAPYPAALNDCYLALEWLKDNGKRYGMRSDQIFVGGDSAGGGLCAAVSLLARDRGDVNIAFQMPLYPMIDDRMITPSSQNNNAPIWNSKSNELGWKLYLGDLYGTDRVPKYAAPARETDYRDLPPTLTYVGDIEPFTDETVEYVGNLRKAGVEVDFRIFEGCFHAFDLFVYTTPAKQARKFLIDGFMYAVENYTAKQK